MLDLAFYMKFEKIKDRIIAGNVTITEAYDLLESIRSRDPIIYNIETTNRCNMRCKMCPRTTRMTRSIEDIDRNTFIRMIQSRKGK